MSRLITDLDPDIQDMCLEHAKLCAAEGVIVIVAQTYRTAAEQNGLHDIGRVVAGSPCHHRGELGPRPIGTCPKHPLGSTVTNAPAGYSFHEFRRAYDLAIKHFDGDKTPTDLYDGPWDKVGDLGERAGMEWGGRWKNPDRPHFEHHGGKTLAQWRDGRA